MIDFKLGKQRGTGEGLDGEISTTTSALRLIVFVVLTLLQPASIWGQNLVETPNSQVIDSVSASYFARQSELEIDLSRVDELYADASVTEWRDAIRSWHEENATLIAQQILLASQLQATVELERPGVDVLTPPRNASEEEQEILTMEAVTTEEISDLYFELRDASANQRRNALRQWHEANAAKITSEIALAEKAFPQVKQSPADLADANIPENASPTAKAFLAEQTVLETEIASIREANCTQTPEQARNAVRVWHDRNRDRLQQLRALAQQLSDDSSG